MTARQLSLLALLLAPACLSAGSSGLGGTFNSDGFGARPMGMGGAFVAMADDASAASENPSGMAFIEKDKRFASFTHAALFNIEGLNREYLAYAQGESGSLFPFGLVWNRLAANLDPETWSEDQFIVSAAKVLTRGEGPRLAVGASLKYMRVDSGLSEASDFLTVGGGTATGYGVNLAVTYRIRPTLTLGLLAQDVYSSLAWSSGSLEVLPPSVRGGLAYKVTPSLTVAGEVRAAQTSAGFNPNSYHLGSEYWLLDGKQLLWDSIRNFGLRAGYTQQVLNGDSGRVSIGGTAKADEWQIDYAYQVGLSVNTLGASHRIGLGLSF